MTTSKETKAAIAAIATANEGNMNLDDHDDGFIGEDSDDSVVVIEQQQQENHHRHDHRRGADSDSCCSDRSCSSDSASSSPLYSSPSSTKKLRSQPPDLIVSVGSDNNRQDFLCYSQILCFASEVFDAMLTTSNDKNMSSNDSSNSNDNSDSNDNKKSLEDEHRHNGKNCKSKEEDGTKQNVNGTTDSTTTTTNASPTNPTASIIIKRIELPNRDPKEWTLFSKFIDPSIVTRTKVDTSNAIALAPWFYEYRMMELLMQCDNVISNVHFLNDHLGMDFTFSFWKTATVATTTSAMTITSATNVTTPTSVVSSITSPLLSSLSSSATMIPAKRDIEATKRMIETMQKLIELISFCQEYNLKKSLLRGLSALTAFMKDGFDLLRYNLDLLKKIVGIYKCHLNYCQSSLETCTDVNDFFMELVTGNSFGSNGNNGNGVGNSCCCSSSASNSKCCNCKSDVRKEEGANAGKEETEFSNCSSTNKNIMIDWDNPLYQCLIESKIDNIILKRKINDIPNQFEKEFVPPASVEYLSRFCYSSHSFNSPGQFATSIMQPKDEVKKAAAKILQAVIHQKFPEFKKENRTST